MAAETGNMVRLSLGKVETLACDVLEAAGMPANKAAIVANVLRRAEQDGAHAHGLFRLPGYVSALRSGRCDASADPMVEETAPGVLRVDAKGGFAPVAVAAGLPRLIDTARRQGIAALGITENNHFGALWCDLEPLAKAGLVAMAFVNTRPFMPAWGGRAPVFGTNPVAFACPRASGSPMIFDMATTAMARGEIMISARDGHSLPEGVGVDSDGDATTDPQAILDGAMLPFGGHKGAAVALMVEIMASALTGARSSREAGEHFANYNDGGPSTAGQCIIAIDPAAFGGEGANGFAARIEALFEAMAGDGARLPADRRYKEREQNRDQGIDVPGALFAQLAALKDSDGAGAE